MAVQTLYDTLGVAQTASTEEIKDAYRRQAMKWHPDRNPNNRAEAEERFKEVGYAYKVLSDPQQRSEYDTYLATQKANADQRRQESSFGDGISGADAVKMFFEQMLDLAFELARRNYDEAVIITTLVSLDCPDSVARSVADAACQAFRHHGSGFGQKASPVGVDKLSDEEAEWERLNPYFAAIISGVHANEKIDENRYQENLERHRIQITGYWVCLFCGLGFFVTGNYNPAIAAGLLATCLLGALGIFVWRLISIPAEFRRELTRRHYLSIFKGLHLSRPSEVSFSWFNGSALFLNAFWFGYWRMLQYALPLLAVYCLISYFAVDIFPINPVGARGIGAIATVLIILFSIFANSIFYRHALAKVRSVQGMSSDQALRHLRSSGGSNSWWLAGYILFAAVTFVPSIIFGGPAPSSYRSTTSAPTVPISEEQKKLHYDQVVGQLEARYPAINPDHPSYNPQIVAQIKGKMDGYVRQGLLPADALIQAVRDVNEGR